MTPIRDHLGHRGQMVLEYQEFPHHRELEVLLECQAFQDLQAVQGFQDVQDQMELQEFQGNLEPQEFQGQLDLQEILVYLVSRTRSRSRTSE